MKLLTHQKGYKQTITVEKHKELFIDIWGDDIYISPYSNEKECYSQYIKRKEREELVINKKIF